MEMANYILSILKCQLTVVWSWGFNSPSPLDNGLQFKVQGFKHKGYVAIIYNEGKDLFEISLLTYQMGLIKKIEEVYFDELVSIIDEEVEKVDNYKQRVESEYSHL